MAILLPGQGAETLDDLRLNPLAGIFAQTRSELAAIVSTIEVGYSRQADVSRYPLESGQQVADHFTAFPTNFYLTGVVDRSALDGAGPSEVALHLNDLMDRGVVFTLQTRAGSWENCVVTEFESAQTPSNVDELQFRVQVTQLRLGRAVLETVQIAGDDEPSSLVSPDAQVPPRVRHYPQRFGVAMDTPAREFVQAQIRALAGDDPALARETGELPAAYAARVAQRTGALQWGKDDAPSLPVLGVSMAEVPLGETTRVAAAGIVVEPLTAAVSLGGVEVRFSLEWRGQSETVVDYSSAIVEAGRGVQFPTRVAASFAWYLRATTSEWRTGDVLMQVMTPIAMGPSGRDGWVLAVPSEAELSRAEAESLAFDSWGRTHLLIWTRDLEWLG